MLSLNVKARLDDPVSRHLRPDCTRLMLGNTVGEALEGLRRAPPADRIIYFYVVDEDGRLQGVMPTRHLLLSPPERPLAEIMIHQVATVPARATVQEACEFFALHRFLALPVVDDERRLLGVIDVDLYTDEMAQLGEAEAREDLFHAIGVYAASPGESSSLGAFRRRIPWLSCNLVGGIAFAVMASLFEAELQKVVALSLFIPVVLNLAESVSSQSVSLTLHLLRGRRPGWREMTEGLRQELSTGLFLGAACGIAVGAVALAWLGQVPLALCVLGGVAGGVMASAILGFTMPITLRLLRLDPKVAAGPIALAGADVITLLLYLGLARCLLG